ncbi:hypothetical protein [Lentibacillus jeotgali]|uniref:hypothetical protein n=1 Tax=Lentibacillus jeotgali TaxID=558169 RepID=UPI00031262B7|nr:hypothetical protein [Lentibacillus jeotgali]
MLELLAGELAEAAAAPAELAGFVVLGHQLVAARSAIVVQPAVPAAELAEAAADQHLPELAEQLAEPAVLVELLAAVVAVVGFVVP